MNRVTRIAGTATLVSLAAVLVTAALGTILAIIVGVAQGVTASSPQPVAPAAAVAAVAAPSACWDEPNSEMPNGIERICGPVNLAPAAAVNFGSYPR